MAATDPYESGEYRYWHLSGRPPELNEAITDGWIRESDRILDVGCGGGAELASMPFGFGRKIGIDRSKAAIRLAATQGSTAEFLVGSAIRLPLRSHQFDVVLDRGCLHYLDRKGGREYEVELRRVLIPGGRMLLRACRYALGKRNDIQLTDLRRLFRRWTIRSFERRSIPTDTRKLDAWVVRLEAGPLRTGP